MEMFGWTEQMCHCYCPGQSCKHWTHRKACTSSLSMTLPSPSGCCPAARSSFAETGLQDPPLGKMRPAITCGEAKVMLQQSTCFGKAKKVSKRRQAFLNCNKKTTEQWEICRKNLHKKELLGEKSNSSHIWPCPKLLQSLLVSHLLIDQRLILYNMRKENHLTADSVGSFRQRLFLLVVLLTLSGKQHWSRVRVEKKNLKNERKKFLLKLRQFKTKCVDMNVFHL